MPLYEPFALMALGVLTGTYGIIIGAGGGFILGPLLILVWGVQPAVAVGTSLAAVFVTAVSGAVGYTRSHSVDHRTGIILAIAEMPGAVFGAIAAAKAPAGVIQLSFGTLLLLLAAYMGARPRARATASARAGSLVARGGVVSRSMVTSTGQRYEYSFNLRLAAGCTAGLGVLSSFFGIGGGLLRVPLLVYGFGFPVTIAVATSIFTMALSTGAGVISHAVLRDVAPLVLLFAGIGVVFGAQVGTRLAPRLRQGVVIRLLAGGLAVAGVSLILHGVGVL